VSEQILSILNNGFILASIIGLIKLAFIITHIHFTQKEHSKDIKDLQDFVYPKSLHSLKK